MHSYRIKLEGHLPVWGAGVGVYMSYVCPELAEVDQKGKREDMMDDEGGGGVLVLVVAVVVFMQESV